ncbi:hypothetical protein AAFF_G00297990 [Aldrovandia affinis]|uniref:Coiled-coil domain-containing protein 39 n=1 Tax=Aldrovandia affinis TaxID=143900 RepID=A0AAD7R987_9TELE|nr:hypothetical protein AAFF_G00297990 [Aldrovandia affinis]
MSSEILPNVGFDALSSDSPVDSAGTEALENVITKKEKQKEMSEGDVSDHRLGIHVLCLQMKRAEQRAFYTQCQEATGAAGENLEWTDRRMTLDRPVLGSVQEEECLNVEERLHVDIAALLELNTQHRLRVTDLLVRVAQKTALAGKKHSALVEERGRTMTTQRVVGTTVELVFQAQLRNERLSEHCTFSCRSMQRRHIVVERVPWMLSQVTEEVCGRQLEVTVKAGLLVRLVSANREAERRSAAEERQVAQLRVRSQGAEPECHRLRGETDVLMRSVDRAGKEAQTQSQELSDLEDTVEERADWLRRARLHTTALQEDLRSASESALGAERRAREWEQTLRREERSHTAQMETESRHRQDYKTLAAKTQDLKSRENRLLANISASQATLKRLEKRRSKNERVLTENKRGLVHDQDVRIAALERKLQSLSKEEEGEMEKRKILQEEVSELAAALQARKGKAYILRQQQKHTEGELRCGGREVEKAAATHTDLLSELEEMELQTDGSDRALQSLRAKRPGTARERERLERDVRRASDCVATEDGRRVAAETERLQLECSARELEVQKAFDRDMHLARTAIARQEQHKLRTEVNSRRCRAEKLRMKYQSMAACSVDTSGERVDLVGRLERWTQKVCEVQAEVQALDCSVRASRTWEEPGVVTPPPDPVPEDCGKKRLMEELKALEENCSSKKRRTHALGQDIKCSVLTEEVESQRKTVEEQVSELLDFSGWVDMMLQTAMGHHTDLESVMRAGFMQYNVAVRPSAPHPASQRGDAPCSPPRSLDSSCSSGADGSPVQSLSLKLAMTRALLSATLPPYSSQGSSPPPENFGCRCTVDMATEEGTQHLPKKQPKIDIVQSEIVIFHTMC